MTTDNIHDKLASLEDERVPAQVVPGRAPTDYTRRETLSILFRIPLNDWQADVLANTEGVLQRAKALHDLRMASALAYVAGDAENGKRLHDQHQHDQLAAIFWFKDLFAAARAEEQARYRKGIRDAAKKALRPPRGER